MYFFPLYILETVMKLNNSKDLLRSVLKTAQQGQVGIRSVLDTSMRPALRKALESQLQEYDAIESEAYAIAAQWGWDLPELDPAARFFSDRKIRLKLNRGNCDSKIAVMLIQENTKGMIQGLKNLHQYPRQCDRICSICQKLLDCETANIRNLQAYL